MRIVIAAAGSQERWGGYLGVPSYLAPVHGEPLLTRTIRQARRLTDDVHVTLPENAWPMPAAMPAAQCHPRSGDHPSEYASTRDLWSSTGRTVLLLGDCYYTDRAMTRIAVHRERDYRVFGRAGRSKVTGTRYGEIFAVSWWPEQHALLDRHLAVVHRARAAGTVTRPPGWMLLRSIQGTPLNAHRVRPPWFVPVQDATDDFDFPADYDRHPARSSM